MRRGSLKRIKIRQYAGAVALAFLLLGSIGCASHPKTLQGRTFDPLQDAFAYRNELRWQYFYDPSGHWKTAKHRPAPKYANRCFPMTRTAREFFYHAEFAPELPKQPGVFYEKAIRSVIARSSRHPAPEKDRVIIPGYKNLHEFSLEHEQSLKKFSGGWCQSYFQRGNWRVVFPFSRTNQEKEAKRLQQKLARGELPIVHLVEFPMLNHAVLLYGLQENDQKTILEAYDPNSPGSPLIIEFEKSSRKFHLPRTPYFPGGHISLYEVYSSPCR